MRKLKCLKLPMTVNMRLKCVLFGFVLGVSLGSANSSCFDSFTDLCNGAMTDMPYLETRDPTMMVTETLYQWEFCDVYAINTNTWYKSKAPMSTECPSMYMCGTKFPIWMKGTNPDTIGGLVNRTSCLRHFDTCCLHTYKLAAINCGEFMAYCFVDIPSNCHQRYCFDVKISGPQTVINQTTAYMQTETEMFNVSLTTITQPSTQGATKTIEVTTDAHSSAIAINTSTMSLPVTYQSTHFTTTAKKNIKELENGDASNISILLACVGLMAAAIIVLVTVIIGRRRMSKVTDKMARSKPLADGDKEYETLGKPEISVIKTSEPLGQYSTISYGSQADNSRGDTKNIGYNNSFYSTIAEHDTKTPNTEKELIEEEDHYDKLP